MTGAAQTVSVPQREWLRRPDTMDVIKLQQAIIDKKQVQFRYGARKDGMAYWYESNRLNDKKKLAYYDIRVCVDNFRITVQPVKVTKYYLIVDPKKTKIRFPKAVVRALGEKKLLEHGLVKYLSKEKKKFYLPYAEEMKIL